MEGFLSPGSKPNHVTLLHKSEPDYAWNFFSVPENSIFSWSKSKKSVIPQGAQMAEPAYSLYIRFIPPARVCCVWRLCPSFSSSYTIPLEPFLMVFSRRKTFHITAPSSEVNYSLYSWSHIKVRKTVNDRKTTSTAKTKFAQLNQKHPKEKQQGFRAIWHPSI